MANMTPEYHLLRRYAQFGEVLLRLRPGMFAGLLAILEATVRGEGLSVGRPIETHLAVRTREELLITAVAVHGTYQAAADAIGMARATLYDQVKNRDPRGTAVLMPFIALGIAPAPDDTAASEPDAGGGEG